VIQYNNQGEKVMKFSGARVNAFYTADQQMRESIRQDVLAERYVDLQQEMGDLEKLLNISEEEKNETLFEINDMLFNIIEMLVPEITEEDSENLLDEQEDSSSFDARQTARKDRIKKREKDAIEVSKKKEELVRAKSDISVARLGLRSAETPQAKTAAGEKLRKARGKLAVAGIKVDAAKD